MNELSEKSTISINQQVAFTQIDEDIVLMGPDNGLFYGINALGAEIWLLLKSQKHSLKTIYEHIQQRYDIDEIQCIADVNHFFAMLQKEGFISITEG